MDVETWLRELHLEQYAALFRTNDIRSDVLADLTDADLAALGISLGDRKRLLRAILSLRPPGERATARRRAPAERRQLTVMFVDLVGSTALSTRLDPEELRELVQAYQAMVAREVSRFEGHVAKLMGDGVLAYFGWPNAHEGEAERAVHAGLAATQAVGQLTAPDGSALAARAGIATGIVVVGDLVGEGAAQEEAVIGETPNLAARLQALADPGAVVIAETTRYQLGRLFDFTDLGARDLPGFAAPVAAFRVTGHRGSAGRFEAMRGSSLTPLVERKGEIGLLLDRWHRARRGEGQVVLIAGEAGIGKSRLLQALRDRLGNEPHTRLTYFCSPFHVSTAFHPILDHIERAARLARDEAASVKLRKLQSLFASGGSSAADTAALTAMLLGIPIGPSPAVSALSPQGRKTKLQRLWLEQLDRLAERHPVLMLIEDAHWIDPTSLEQFDLVVERIQRLPVLLVVTSRPEFQPSWQHHAHIATLALDRLDRQQSAALIRHMAAGKSLPEPILQQLVAKADGVPLFLEELTRTVLASGQLEVAGDAWRLAGPLPALAIPDTLHSSLLARLDRLTAAKGVAQVAAAIGREFPRDLLSAVTGLDHLALDDALSGLAGDQLIYPCGPSPCSTFAFKHALVQDAAYATLLRARRQIIHSRIAAALDERPDGCPPEVLAHHLTEAGEADRSVELWTQAGRLAVSRAASREAVAHFERAIAQLMSLPDTIERKRREAMLQDALGGALAHVAGVASEARAKVYERTRDLCQQTGDSKSGFIADWNLWHVHVCRTDHRQVEVEALGERLMAAAEQENDQELLLQALHVEWVAFCAKGQHREALASCERGWAIYDPARHGSHHLTYGAHDPGVCSRNECANALWYLGQPDRARACYEQGLALARRLDHPLVALHALAKGLPLFQLLRDHDRLSAQAEATFHLAAEQDSANFGLEAQFMRAWLLSGEGEAEHAVRLMQAGLQDHRRRGAMGISPYYMSLLARAQARAGAFDEALATLDAEHTRIREGSSPWSVPDLLRIRGDILVEMADEATAEQCFLDGLALARASSGRGYELSIATSLARLWARQNRREEVKRLLAPVYQAFEEGFGTPDLRDARALLAGLA